MKSVEDVFQMIRERVAIACVRSMKLDDVYMIPYNYLYSVEADPFFRIKFLMNDRIEEEIE